MLELIATTLKKMDDYRPIVGEAKIQELRALAQTLQGVRVLHISATAFGGGVAEMLSRVVPHLCERDREHSLQKNGHLSAFYQIRTNYPPIIHHLAPFQVLLGR